MQLEQSPISVEDVKVFLRVHGSDEDALIGTLVCSASELCEAFTGVTLIARDVEETIPASTTWRRLMKTPMRAVTGVAALNPDRTETPLPASDFAVDIDASGDGWVRMLRSGGGGARVRYSAGMAGGSNGVPEALRQGIVRMAAHLYTYRDGGDDAGPPAAVTALWRPWRRMRIA